MKILGVLIGVAISIIVVGSVLAPIVNDVAAESDTYVNDGYFDMKKYTAEDNVVLTWSYNDPDKVIVNEEVVELPDMPVVTSIILASNGAVRLTINHNSLSFYSGGNFVNADESNPNFSFTYSGGSATASNGNAERTISVDALYMIANEGDYVMKKADVPVYVNSDTEICAFGLTYFGSSRMYFSIWGTFNEYQTGYSTSAVITNFSKNYVTSDNHTDLYLLEDFTFDATLNDTTKLVEYSYFAVEKEVSADRTNPLDRSAAVILMVSIPLVLISLIYFVVKSRY